VKPLPADAEERFRGSFLKEETPAFTDYRVKVIETPEVTPVKADERPQTLPMKANGTPEAPPRSPSE